MSTPEVRYRFHCSVGHWVTSTNEDIEEGPCPALFGADKVPCTGTLGEALVPAWQHQRALEAARRTESA